MELDPDTCYASLLAKDRRFDGWFFVGVTSTGIYCRPVCAVRPPMRRNCLFFTTAAAAEDGGFRPCLRCRPELAPGREREQSGSALAQAAATMIGEGFLRDGAGDVAALAARVGLTERHLLRLFQQEYGVSIIAFAQTQRLLLAKRLLTDTLLPVAIVAQSAGFGSVRRFNDVFLRRYGFSPSRLRKSAGDEAGAPGRSGTSDKGDLAGAHDAIVLPLAYRPPYAWDAMRDFLARRAIPGVETVNGDTYGRTVRWAMSGVATGKVRDGGGIGHVGAVPRGDSSDTIGVQVCHGWFQVRHTPQRQSLSVTISASLLPVLAHLLPRIRGLFDLDARPDLIDAHLDGLARDTPGLRVPGAMDGFELAVRAVLGQQVSVERAVTVLGRFAAAFGEQVLTAGVAPDHMPFTHCFPSADAVYRAIGTIEAAPDLLCPLGMIRSRARAIFVLAQALAERRLLLSASAPVAQTVAALEALPGIGPWTAQYIAMRALRWPNAWPDGDGVLLKQTASRNAAALRVLAEQWAPWRAYAAMHLWRQAALASNETDKVKEADVVIGGKP